MATSSKSDILQALPLEKWHLLRDGLKRDWPKYSHYYYLIDNAIKWKSKDASWDGAYYCPAGQPDRGVFLAVSRIPVYNIIPFAFKESRELLGECLLASGLINWRESVMLRAIHEDFDDAIEAVVQRCCTAHDLEVYETRRSRNFIKSKESCAAVVVTVPSDVQLRDLSESHAATICAEWPRQEFKNDPERTIKYLSTIIRLNRGIGLFAKRDRRLVSWALHNDWGGLGMLQTLDDCKGRGYARIVSDALAKILAEDGLDSTLMIVEGNHAAEGLFGSMGYAVTNDQRYIKVRPINCDG